MNMVTMTRSGRVGDLRAAATAPVDGASLAVVRIAFGAIGLLSALRLVRRGWVGTLFADPTHHLRYPGLGWVPVPPGWAMYVLVGMIAATAAAILVGWHFRIAMATFLVAFTWLELVEATVYLNHYWFMTLAGVLFLCLPMSATVSLDARRRGSLSVPAGAVWLVRFQVGLVYCFAGLAKLHGDWLLHGLPLGLWLPARTHLPLLGDLLAARPTALVASWTGAAFDCTIVAFLLWRRTRLAAWCVVVAFHIVTWWLFPVIGVFPWLMIASSTVFFDPDWPRRVARRFGGAGVPTDPPAPLGDPWWERHRRAVAVTIVAWALLQVALPLRHLAYPGDHRWSGEGLRFGWNVMLVEKAGIVTFRLTDPVSGHTWTDDASAMLTLSQRRVMTNDPELIRQTAHLLADQVVERGEVRPQVRVDAMVSLNGRPAAPMIDPDVDLAAEPWRLGHQHWILAAPSSPPPR
jgi:hypothetical protein